MALKLTLDPMPALRDHATMRVNWAYNQKARDTMQRDQAHALKRAQATDIVGGGQAPVEFQAEAELRGITAQELAGTILSKPNLAAQRELERQTIMMKIETMTTPADLEKLLTDLGIPGL